MTSIVTFLFLFILTHALGALLVKGADRKWVSMVMLTAWLCLFPLLFLMNGWFSFSGGGDDEGYFRESAIPIDSLNDVFDMTRFVESTVQSGYPWLLSIVNH